MAAGPSAPTSQASWPRRAECRPDRAPRKKRQDRLRGARLGIRPSPLPGEAGFWFKGSVESWLTMTSIWLISPALRPEAGKTLLLGLIANRLLQQLTGPYHRTPNRRHLSPATTAGPGLSSSPPGDIFLSLPEDALPAALSRSTPGVSTLAHACRGKTWTRRALPCLFPWEGPSPSWLPLEALMANPSGHRSPTCCTGSARLSAISCSQNTDAGPHGAPLPLLFLHSARTQGSIWGAPLCPQTAQRGRLVTSLYRWGNRGRRLSHLIRVLRMERRGLAGI